MTQLAQISRNQILLRACQQHYEAPPLIARLSALPAFSRADTGFVNRLWCDDGAHAGEFRAQRLEIPRAEAPGSRLRLTSFHFPSDFNVLDRTPAVMPFIIKYHNLNLDNIK
jgi:hypothetical protein